MKNHIAYLLIIVIAASMTGCSKKRRAMKDMLGEYSVTIYRNHPDSTFYIDTCYCEGEMIKVESDKHRVLFNHECYEYDILYYMSINKEGDLERIHDQDYVGTYSWENDTLRVNTYNEFYLTNGYPKVVAVKK